MSRRGRRLVVDARLDLTPIMSLVVHLIPLLLVAVRLREVAQLDSTARVVPAIRTSDGQALADQAERVVSVRVGADGFLVTGAGGLDPRIPCRGACAPDTYDYAALGQALVEARRLHPGQEELAVVAEPEVPYAVVVGVMDTARGGPDGPRFRQPVLVSGARP